MAGRNRVLLFAATTVFSAVFLIDFCGLIYQCGCRSLWAGAARHCNVHTAGAPDCPWCSIGMSGSLAILLSIVASQFLVVFGLPRLGTRTRVLLAFAAFPISGGILAVLVGLWKGYWN